MSLPSPAAISSSMVLKYLITNSEAEEPKLMTDLKNISDTLKDAGIETAPSFIKDPYIQFWSAPISGALSDLVYLNIINVKTGTVPSIAIIDLEEAKRVYENVLNDFVASDFNIDNLLVSALARLKSSVR